MKRMNNKEGNEETLKTLTDEEMIEERQSNKKRRANKCVVSVSNECMSIYIYGNN